MPISPSVYPLTPTRGSWYTTGPSCGSEYLYSKRHRGELRLTRPSYSTVVLGGVWEGLRDTYNQQGTSIRIFLLYNPSPRTSIP